MSGPVRGRRSAPRKVAVLAAALAIVLAGCGGEPSADPASESGSAAEVTSAPTVPGPPYDEDGSVDYTSPLAWICRPDLAADACRDLDVTRVEASGEQAVERREPDPAAPVDCFYVYPTVTTDPGLNSDLLVAPSDAEVSTVATQAAPYARSCRVFAPIYRQVTLEALNQGRYAEGLDAAYDDVLDAWRTYLAAVGSRRGVIVVGHSQGAMLLQRLLDEEVDPDPQVRRRLVAAHLFGTSVQVPPGELVGGTFAEIPGCASADETGCVVTWSSYAATSTPPVDALFGRAGESTRALCTDAVDLLGRSAASAIVPTAGLGEDASGITTPFVSLPQVVTVACASAGEVDYLAVGLTDPDDPRPVAPLVTETLGPAWGLHPLDMSLALDDLVDLAARQGAAYTG